MNWCSVFCQKGRISLSPLATQPHDDVPKSRYAFQPLLWDVSCHNSHQGELTNSLAHIFTQQKCDNLPLASLHSGEKPQHKGTDGAGWRMFPTAGGFSQRKFSTAEPTPYAVMRTSCKLCAVAAFSEENPVFRWKYGFPSF